MKEFKTIEEILDNHKDVTKFKYNYTKYYENTKLKNFLNSMFGGKIQSVFSSGEKSYFSGKNKLSWDNEIWLIVNHRNKVILMSNSEWAAISQLEK